MIVGVQGGVLGVGRGLLAALLFGVQDHAATLGSETGVPVAPGLFASAAQQGQDEHERTGQGQNPTAQGQLQPA
ncbi:hypothetical protein AB0L26_26035 [Streptomyces nondiastaticus]|uniref:hypothetical protein n=1 Tax=Streptomyces nondiastaticus TaxID=3154512 RepID=UPI00342DAF3F